MAAQHLALDGDQTSPLARLRPNGQPLRKRAIVNGGGIGGLTAARALLDAGCDVAVFVRRPLEEMLGGPSGLDLAANAMHALRCMSGASEGRSLAQDEAAAGVAGRRFVMATQAGSLVQTYSFGGADSAPSPHSSYSITRPNLQRALYAALPPGTVTCGAAFRSFRLLGDGRMEVTLVLGGRQGGGEGGGEGGGGSSAPGEAGAGGQERGEVCDLLVGADGIRSHVRACLEERHGIPPRLHEYTGHSYSRGLVDLSKWPGGADAWQKKWQGVHLLYGARGGGITYQARSCPAEQRHSVTPSTVCFGRYVPAPQGAYKPGATTPAEAKRDLEELCRGYGSPMHELSLLAEPAAIANGELWHLPPPTDVWGAGCVTLVGDSAHALVPALGQGACQAIEDAVELGAVLHQAASAKASATAGDASSAQLSGAELEAALRRYEAARGPHVARVHNLAAVTFHDAVGESWWGRLKRGCRFRLAPASWLRPGGPWLTRRRFSWDGPPTTV